LNRCVVFQDAAASDGATIGARRRDANDQPSRAGSAPALPANGATTTAEIATTDGQLGGSADSNERGRRNIGETHRLKVDGCGECDVCVHV
jgi:hypothetical protein